MQTLGYNKICPEQFDAVFNFVKGNDVLISLPMDKEKSLCFVCLPLVYDRLQEESIAVIVLPLNSMMQDLVASFSSHGVTAAHVCDDSSPSVSNNVINGEVQFMYMSPETILIVP